MRREAWRLTENHAIVGNGRVFAPCLTPSGNKAINSLGTQRIPRTAAGLDDGANSEMRFDLCRLAVVVLSEPQRERTIHREA